MQWSNFMLVLVPLVYLAGLALIALVLFWVIRAGISRGLRDHQLWMERNRPQGPGFTPQR